MMPSPDALATALEKQRIRRAVEQRLQRQEEELARPVAGQRVRPWPIRCAGCGEVWPCQAWSADPQHAEEEQAYEVGAAGLLTAIGLLAFAVGAAVTSLVMLG